MFRQLGDWVCIWSHLGVKIAMTFSALSVTPPLVQLFHLRKVYRQKKFLDIFYSMFLECYIYCMTLQCLPFMSQPYKN